MYKLLFLLLLCINAFSQNFKVASYNVENLFDLTKQNSEYKEFIPNTNSNWNSKTFNIKLNNVIKVIKEIDADIIALQEIENKAVLQQLFKRLPQYKYYSFAKYPRSAVGVAFLSKIKIRDNRQIDVKFRNKLFRPILESTFEIDNQEFKIFNNHWPSKAVPESYRVTYAKELQDRLVKLPKDYDYILLGDFNSNYDEMFSIKSNRKLNNTDGITGINQILNTSYNNKLITYSDISKIDRRVHINLWQEQSNKNRFSNKYRGGNNTPDNIILSAALFDTKKISYIPNSFEVFKPSYLYKNNYINRWQMIGNHSNRKHKGEGYSDHLPIYATFSTSEEDRNIVKELKKIDHFKINNIQDLYLKEKLNKSIILKDVTVIYKASSSAVIKDNTRAIYLYKNAKNLELGYKYDLEIKEIINYNGLKEVTEFSILDKKSKNYNYKDLYLNGQNINILKENYQNEIVENLEGIVKNRKLYFQEDIYIKLYAKNKNDLPKNGEKVLFTTAHLTEYKGTPQILIHSKNDYKVVK
ncbi:hypothetical protein GCM10012288_17360 [Malaciobacter pacificus]|uniref:Endonuclease/exonuclease/phosphatase n=1 Tax=Malaciobacter pacificus TaxID=1080223 RepID=A0A5C2HD67_9BACT|nr:endonuclease/exonuclease/phosphatase family protein [Malaciobacter pacificus]QEP34774.1 endonuclease/exonuclease/phosphatase [Malaciobacter pacificus]GGD43577.1 hypothetical protein GCM10012288_17360 [Malaciobacter pacificus]